METRRFPCPLGRCDGFEVGIDMGAITGETFQVISDAQHAHLELHRPAETHIRKKINPNHRKGNGFYRLTLGPSENGSQTLCGGEPTSEDMGWGETRWEKNLAYVSCEACKTLRRAS